MRRGIAGVLLVLGALAAVYGWTRAVPPPVPPEAPAPTPEEAPSGPLAELRWVREGSRVLVDQRWLWEPEGGTFTALPSSAVRPVEGGGEEWLHLALSRDGTRIALWDAREFQVGPVDAALAGPSPLPFTPAPDEEDVPRARLLFWNGQDALFFMEQRLDMEVPAACARFEPSSRSWHRVETCPQGSFLRLVQVDPGPGDLVAVLSESEGASDIRLTRYTEGTAPREDASPVGFELFPSGSVRTAFSRDGARWLLTTPCALERAERPCEGVEDDAPWRLYTWHLAERRLTREREGLPAGVGVSSEGRLAWPEPGRVCVGDPAERKRCQPLPVVPREGVPRAE